MARPEKADQTVNDRNKNEQANCRDIVRIGSGSDRDSNSILRGSNSKNAKKNRTRQIQKMSVILVIALLCLAKNLPTPGKGGGPFLLAK